VLPRLLYGARPQAELCAGPAVGMGKARPHWCCATGDEPSPPRQKAQSVAAQSIAPWLSKSALKRPCCSGGESQACKLEIDFYFAGMIKRLISELVRHRLAHFPAVALVGPRQCGKTTLARTLAGQYFDLEQPPERLRLDLGWDDLIGRRGLVVLDEAQAWPEVFRRLRAAIETAGSSSRFSPAAALAGRVWRRSSSARRMD